MENQTTAAVTHEQACAARRGAFPPALAAQLCREQAALGSRFSPAAFELLRGSRAPLLDVGCGVGLLPFYLRERGLAATRSPGSISTAQKFGAGTRWRATSYRDIDLREQDVATTDVAAFRGNVAIFDLLHYLPPAAQESLLLPARQLTSRPAACS